VTDSVNDTMKRLLEESLADMKERRDRLNNHIRDLEQRLANWPPPPINIRYQTKDGE